MASALIHICVAKKLNETLKVDEKALFLGSIAPDLSKQIGLSKEKSHFLSTPKDSIPNTFAFIDKYKDQLNNPFLLGYFIHLYTDKIWFDEFMRKKVYEGSVHLMDGTTISTSPEEILKLIYDDYTNLNVQLIDEYNLDLSLFYEDLILPTIEMDEIPISKLPVLIEKMGIIIANSKNSKSYVFDLDIIKKFIDYSVDKILKKIVEYEIKVHP